jgi:hypothetical protein
VLAQRGEARDRVRRRPGRWARISTCSRSTRRSGSNVATTEGSGSCRSRRWCATASRPRHSQTGTTRCATTSRASPGTASAARDDVPRDVLRRRGRPAYLRAVGSKWLISAVARAMRPGEKVDTVLILEGLQGLGKSSAFRALGVNWFSDTAIDISNKDSLVARVAVLDPRVRRGQRRSSRRHRHAQGVPLAQRRHVPTAVRSREHQGPAAVRVRRHHERGRVPEARPDRLPALLAGEVREGRPQRCAATCRSCGPRR